MVVAAESDSGYSQRWKKPTRFRSTMVLSRILKGVITNRCVYT